MARNLHDARWERRQVAIAPGPLGRSRVVATLGTELETEAEGVMNRPVTVTPASSTTDTDTLSAILLAMVLSPLSELARDASWLRAESRGLLQHVDSSEVPIRSATSSSA